MTKNEYLAELKAHLASLPAEERDGAIKYYQEFFEDAGAENEQKVIEELGDPKSLAEKIISEIMREVRLQASMFRHLPGMQEMRAKILRQNQKRMKIQKS